MGVDSFLTQALSPSIVGALRASCFRPSCVSRCAPCGLCMGVLHFFANNFFLLLLSSFDLVFEIWAVFTAFHLLPDWTLPFALGLFHFIPATSTSFPSVTLTPPQFCFGIPIAFAFRSWTF